jgi:hypothetical protein
MHSLISGLTVVPPQGPLQSFFFLFWNRFIVHKIHAHWQGKAALNYKHKINYNYFRDINMVHY